MENKQAVKQLKALRTFHNQFIEDNKDIENSFSKQLVEALEIAIKALEVTALEVPVQEQLSNLEARQILENRFKVLAEECEPEFLDKTTDSMINIYTTLFPNQFFQE
ncbi:hypothetical protein [Clostridium neonatale]|uniref:hypothetical protein n=1 Tax=Clostridium neonatale TaxID=137838 RepID=UPI00291BB914|nr:hypothetical protein [Clostridium neonatale]CAI3673670.1 hypothetical protein CNEO4_350014 [Clostridium neonatale]CAI3675227.1 hypothetical protein CNEO4_370015 [Clostridium neonatale]